MQGIRFSAMALPLGQKHDHRPVSAKDNVTGKTVTFDDWELRLQGAGNNGVKKGLPFEDPPYTLVADLKLNGKKSGPVSRQRHA